MEEEQELAEVEPPPIHLPIPEDLTEGDRSKDERESLVQPNSQDKILMWLNGQGVEVEKSHEEADSDRVFDRLSKHIGESYTEDRGGYILKNFLSRLRWTITQNKPGMQFRLGDANQTQTRIVTAIARELNHSSLFSNSRYVKNDKVLHIGLADEPYVRSFLTGGWFEQFIFQEIETLLNKSQLSFQSLKNATVRFPNQDRFELDLLFLISGKPLLVECKTSSSPDALNKHLSKFANHCKKLSLEKDRAFLVVLDLKPIQEEDLDSLKPFRTASQATFLPKLRTALGLDVSPKVDSASADYQQDCRSVLGTLSSSIKSQRQRRSLRCPLALVEEHSTYRS